MGEVMPDLRSFVQLTPYLLIKVQLTNCYNAEPKGDENCIVRVGKS